MDRGTTGEVDRVQLVVDPTTVLGGKTVSREHPVCNREVDQRRPQPGEHQPGGELQPVGHGARDQRDGDDREHKLEGNEHGGGHGAGQRDIGRRSAAGRFHGVAANQAFQAPVIGRVAYDAPFVVTK